MPTVRLSGTILGADDPARSTRAKLLYLLYEAGWDIYNSNGDQRITLANIEEKIIESDAFVFTPGATLEDMFKAISVFVGYQTLDRFLTGKPTIILNCDQSWNPFYKLLRHLEAMETIKQDHSEFMLNAETPKDVIRLLDRARERGTPDAEREKVCSATIPATGSPPPADSRGNVCVFCSATLEDPAYIADGEALGRQLAENRLGCVSGAGRSGIMGAVVRGSVQAGGWTAGSNVPHIIELEGLPDGLSQFWLREDIYTRMEVMIHHSNAFVIFPGGAGTVQELFTLMIFKQQGHPIMKDKPIVIFNRRDPKGDGFWDPLIALLDELCETDNYQVADSLDDIIPAVTRNLIPS
ncbi:LOG family protein [Haloferula chungangensis]|uniref:AMP nucleosidase n=1 Tax=Haloferula chungangensis TaxID=1048331 RepID=A0ABW2L2L2_9BACT